MATGGFNAKKVVFDTVLVLAVGGLVYGLRKFGSPKRQGFFCDDQSIRYPLIPDTISDTVLALTTVLGPIAVICVWEAVRIGRAASSGVTLRGVSLPLWLIRAYKQAGMFICGAGFAEVTTDVSKYYVGRLRPHFIAACQPVGLVDLCAASTPGNPVYLSEDDYVCSGGRDREMEARVSFPSAHATMAFYAAVYLGMYMQARGPRGLVRLLLQWGLLVAAWWTTLSRCVDHMHHPQDVAVGGAIGCTFAVLQVVLASGLYSQRADSDGDLVALSPAKTYTAPNCV